MPSTVKRGDSLTSFDELTVTSLPVNSSRLISSQLFSYTSISIHARTKTQIASKTWSWEMGLYKAVLSFLLFSTLKTSLCIIHKLKDCNILSDVFRQIRSVGRGAELPWLCWFGGLSPTCSAAHKREREEWGCWSGIAPRLRRNFVRRYIPLKTILRQKSCVFVQSHQCVQLPRREACWEGTDASTGRFTSHCRSQTHTHTHTLTRSSWLIHISWHCDMRQAALSKEYFQNICDWVLEQDHLRRSPLGDGRRGEGPSMLKQEHWAHCPRVLRWLLKNGQSGWGLYVCVHI